MRSRDGAEAVLDAIERWRPTGVFGFAVTWAEMARFDLAARDLSSVRNWFNTGDCAHEAHIRRLVAVGSHLEPRPGGGLREVAGSKFIDSLGSTEMGHSAFFMTHVLGSESYDRCVGQVFPFAEIKLLDVATGQEVPDGTVGQAALKSPTLALGYWNDSLSHVPQPPERLLPDRRSAVPRRGGPVPPRGPRRRRGRPGRRELALHRAVRGAHPQAVP